MGAYGGPRACDWIDDEDVVEPPSIGVDISSATVSPGETVSISIDVAIPDTLSIYSMSLGLNCLSDPLTMSNIDIQFDNLPDGWLGYTGTDCPVPIWMAGSEAISGYSNTILTFDVEVSDQAAEEEIIITIDSISFDETDYDFNINDGVITIIDDTPPLVPNYGDVSLNNEISPLDASLVLQYDTELINLNEQQQLNADVSGDGTISGMDASYILQYGVGLIDEFPVENNTTVVSATGDYYMDYYSYNDGSQFSIPVFLENGSELYAFKHQFTYDSEIISIDEIVRGDNIDEFMVQFNSENNELIVSGANSDSDGVSGIFFTINGTLNDPSIFGQSTNLSLNEVRLNEDDPTFLQGNYSVLILNGTLGDLNSDTGLNILDLIVVSSITLEQIEPTLYQSWAGDIDSNSLISVLDIIMIVNMILDN